MGCDIHVYFETLQDGKWRPTFGSGPDPKYWYERIAEDKMESGAADIAIIGYTEMSEREQSVAVDAYFSAIPLDEAERQYGEDPRFNRTFNIPNEEDYSRDVMRIGGRDYRFFGAVAGVRYPVDGAFKARGYPDDVSFEVLQEIKQYGEDGHTHSWLDVQEMLDSKLLQEHAPHQLQYLREHIPDPKNTRMVFYFDN
jgi:hypothetical protein